MKRILIIFLVPALLLLLTTCKKAGFDPMSKSQSDFIGTWSGTLTAFKNNKLIKQSGLFLIYPEEGGTLLGGIIYLSETRVFREFQFQNGTLYFKVFNTDPDNASCQNWNLGGYASFSESDKMEIRISGNECGLIGSEYVDWSGTLVSSPVKKDSLACFTFAKTGNNWTYKITKNDGDSCELLKLLGVKSGDYAFSGESTHQCGWPLTNIPVKWTVTPSNFTIRTDMTLVNHEISIPVYAKYGVTYKSYPSPDTVTLTLLDTNKVVTTIAGTFFCNYYKYTETGYRDDGVRNTRTSYLWLNYHYGVIKQEVINPFDSTWIVKQSLKAKNFQTD